MPEFFIFLIKVNVSLILFCLAYYLILRRLTFYTLNRFFLIAGIVFSSLYPFIDVSIFFREPGLLIVPLATALPGVYAIAREASDLDYWFVANVVFWIGVIFMSLRMVISLYALRKVHKGSVLAMIHGYQVRLLSGNLNTFSFWKNIYLNPSQHEEGELKDILEHEQVHVNDFHTLDILLAEVAVIFYWFNPGVWYMRKAVKENVEFITDRKILLKGADRKAYQYSMLHTGTGVRSSVLINNFNITGIKRRIIMMNSKESTAFQLYRYVFLLPVIVISCMAFSFVKGGKSEGNRKDSRDKQITLLEVGLRSSGELSSEYRPSGVAKKNIPSYPFDNVKAKVASKKEVRAAVQSNDNTPIDNASSVKTPNDKTPAKIIYVINKNVVTKTGLADTKQHQPLVQKFSFTIKGENIKDTTVVTDKLIGKVIVVRTTEKRKDITGTGVIQPGEKAPSKIYINGKETSSAQMRQMNPDDILNIRIAKNPADTSTRAIYIMKRQAKN